MKKKLVWITPDFFADCDLNEKLMEGILKEYNIDWMVLLPYESPRYKESDFDNISKLEGLNISFHYYVRHRNPFIVFFYIWLRLILLFKRFDVLYINMPVSHPVRMPFFLMLPKRKTILASHDGNVKADVQNKGITEKTLAYMGTKFDNYLMFSNVEADSMQSNFPKAKIFRTFLALKNYGKPTVSKSNNDVVFLSFGSLHEGKNVGLLIKAAEVLISKGINGFKVKIYGSCSNWNIYQALIKHPKFFDIRIEQIPIEDIPNLFESSHYQVLPYKNLSQSGAIKVGFQYNLPVVVSDLPEFHEEVQDGTNGFFFKSEDLDSLVELMSRLIVNHRTLYPSLQETTKKFIQDNYLSEHLAELYLDAFNYIYKSK